MTTKLAVLGAGRMGAALARSLVGAGYETHVWNRTRAKLDALLAAGARAAARPSDAIDAADVAVIMVSDRAASDALVEDAAVTAALAGKLLVDLTSGTPRQARARAAWAAAHGIDA